MHEFEIHKGEVLKLTVMRNQNKKEVILLERRVCWRLEK